MELGVAASQVSLEDAAGFLGDRLTPGSVCRLLSDEGRLLSEDDYVADLWAQSRLGRPTVPCPHGSQILHRLRGTIERPSLREFRIQPKTRSAIALHQRPPRSCS
jgi:hypothetical protein